MFPTLPDLIGFGPPLDVHGLFVALGLLAGGVVFVLEARRTGTQDPRLPALVLGALVGAGVFARLGTWAQHLDPSKNLSLGEQMLAGNASILSALVGAWAGVHIAKRLVGYTERTGDLFTPAVALAMVIGRFGCFFTERPGVPTGTDWGIVLTDEQASRVGSAAGVPLHPSFLYEVAFHLVAFCMIWFWLRHAGIRQGETLTLFLAGYALFRFCVEFVRGNEIAWMGLTRPQLFLSVSIPLLLARLVWLWRQGAFLPRERSTHDEHQAA